MSDAAARLPVGPSGQHLSPTTSTSAVSLPLVLREGEFFVSVDLATVAEGRPAGPSDQNNPTISGIMESV